MKKILILANNDVGLYKFRKELIQSLIDRGDKVYISLPYGKLVEPLKEIGCEFIDTPVDRRGINPITDFKLITRYLKILMNINPDMVITYTVKPNVYGGIVCRIMNITYATNITGLGTAFQSNEFLKRLIIFLYRLACKKARVVFFENEENQEIFIYNKIVRKENACKLNGAGVNLEEYKFLEYPNDNSETRFLFVGRIMKEKGVDEFFEVAKRLKRNYDKVVFDVVGPLEDDYEEIINELKEKGIINFYGYQTDVKPFIEKAHCFVLPSYHEGMANTNLESAASGRPVITSNIAGCMEAVEDGITGYLVLSKSSDDLYEKMKKFCELPYENRKKMGLAGRKRMEVYFDKKVVVAETIRRL
ncbi:MAG: glycosyltransferase family 4 protein [Turicibacter sp.]|nr:glycosyltransferase family 4 protein [Turicibacter sp.]